MSRTPPDMQLWLMAVNKLVDDVAALQRDHFPLLETQSLCLAMPAGNWLPCPHAGKTIFTDSESNLDIQSHQHKLQIYTDKKINPTHTARPEMFSFLL